MKLKDILNVLRLPCYVKIRDKDDFPICDCNSNAKGVYPYLELEVVEWFVYTLDNSKNTICVLVNDVSWKEKKDD